MKSQVEVIINMEAVKTGEQAVLGVFEKADTAQEIADGYRNENIRVMNITTHDAPPHEEVGTIVKVQ